MSYEKQNFTDGQTLTAAHLNHIEDGIAAAESASGGASAALTDEEKALLLALFGDATYKTGTGAAKLAALTTLWGGSAPETGAVELCSKTSETGLLWADGGKYAYLHAPLSVKQTLTLKKVRFQMKIEGDHAVTVGVSDVTNSTFIDFLTEDVTPVDGTAGVSFTCNIIMEPGKKYRIWAKTKDEAVAIYAPNLADADVSENAYFSVVSDTASDYWNGNTAIRFKGYLTVEAGSHGKNQMTLRTLAVGSNTVWNTITPKANYIYCPFTVKKPLTLKGLRFSLNTDNAQALTMGVSDVTETEVVDLATQNVTSVEGETEVNFACSLSMETGKKYRIWIKTDSGDAIMAYPTLPDEKVAEKDYFSIASETASDYRWNNTKIKFVGFVTVEV